VLYTALGGPGMDELQIFEGVKNGMAFLKRELSVDVGKKDSFITVSLSYKDHDEAVKVVVTNDEWADDDPSYAQNAEGWPRILSRLKTLLETGKTFRPH